MGSNEKTTMNNPIKSNRCIYPRSVGLIRTTSFLYITMVSHSLPKRPCGPQDEGVLLRWAVLVFIGLLTLLAMIILSGCNPQSRSHLLERTDLDLAITLPLPSANELDLSVPPHRPLLPPSHRTRIAGQRPGRPGSTGTEAISGG